jgi:hypothetical protein
MDLRAGTNMMWKINWRVNGAVLGYHVVSSDNFLLTVWDNLSRWDQ